MATASAPHRFFLPAGLQDFCVLIGMITLLSFQMNNFADDPGVGWHLKTGERVATLSQIPTVDPFLHSATARPWFSDQWFSDLLIYKFFSSGGWPLVYAMLAAVYLFTFFGVLYRGVSRITGSYLASSAAVFVAFKAAELHFILRPVLLGFFFFACVYITLYSAVKELGEGRPNGVGRYYFHVVLPLLFVVWTNVHPSFILGLLLMAILIVSLILDRVLLGEKLCLALVRRLLVIFVACFAATCLNPYGIDLHRSIFELSQSSYFMSLHMEWMSPDFKLPEGEFFLIIAGTIFTSLFLGGTSKLRWHCFEFLLVAVFGYLALRSVRVLPFFGIAAAVPLVYAIVNFKNCVFFARLRASGRLPQMLSNIELRERRSGRGLFILTCILLALLFDALLRGQVLLFSGEFGPTQARFPYGNVAYLNTQSEGRHIVVAATPDWGGFITYAGRANIQPIIDDRNSLLGEAFYKEFYDKMRVGPQLIPYLRSLGATHLLISKGSAIVPWLKDNGLMTAQHEDSVSVLYQVPR